MVEMTNVPVWYQVVLALFNASHQRNLESYQNKLTQKTSRFSVAEIRGLTVVHAVSNLFLRVGQVNYCVSRDRQWELSWLKA